VVQRVQEVQQPQEDPAAQVGPAFLRSSLRALDRREAKLMLQCAYTTPPINTLLTSGRFGMVSMKLLNRPDHRLNRLVLVLKQKQAEQRHQG
jgi:hypothetical protein